MTLFIPSESRNISRKGAKTQSEREKNLLRTWRLCALARGISERVVDG
jgi:hypothetical protein